MIEWIKSHKGTTIVIIVFLIMMFFASSLFRVFLVNSGNPVYGDRLDDIETVEITKTNISNLEKGIKENEAVKEMNYSLTGKIISVKITFSEATSADDARKVGLTVLDYFDKEQKLSYGIEVYLIKEEESESFPIIGYKHYTSTDMSWTKNR